jgi:hypothetical protein
VDIIISAAVNYNNDDNMVDDNAVDDGSVRDLLSNSLDSTIEM